MISLSPLMLMAYEYNQYLKQCLEKNLLTKIKNKLWPEFLRKTNIVVK